MYKPYSIWTPDFEITSGGIRVMWGLYGWLLAKGQIAFVNAKYYNPDFIAIYPEIARGNDLGANTVVRYILNKPGVMTTNGVPGPTKFDPTDKVYYFSRLFGGSAEEDNFLFLPILNMHLFRDQHKVRNKTAYFIGKGNRHPYKSLHPIGSILIDRNIAQNQGDLADLLNECEVLYCYDPVSAITELARLCGCRIVMINPIYTYEDFFTKYEPGMNGISWGKDEGIKLDIEKFTQHYKDMVEEFDWRLDAFIEDTQSN